MSFLGLLKKAKPTAAELREAVAVISVRDLEAKVTELESERRRLLLDGSEADILAIEAKIATANREVERACAAVEEYTTRIAAAEARELMDEVERTAAAMRDDWTALKTIYLGIDRHQLALAGLLAELAVVYARFEARRTFCAEHGRKDIAVESPLSMLGRHTGQPIHDPRYALKLLPGYADGQADHRVFHRLSEISI